jgi:NADH-quinone oxidoreductase subunit I
MTLWERLYIFEIVRGLILTAVIFFRNMLRWISGGNGAATVSYPESVRADLSPVNRGKHVLTRDKDGNIKCVACYMCQWVCPARCIKIEAEEFADEFIQKRPKSFDIDFARCIFCGFCEDACPKDAIRLTPDWHISDFTRDKVMLKHKEDLMSWNPTVTKCET